MHSASGRFNSITLFTALVIAALCLINFTHGYLVYDPKAQVDFSIRDPLNFIDTKFWEQAAFKYSMRADLSSLYTWNLKQLFVYIEFEWVDPATNFTSRTIGSDWILQMPEDKSKLQEAWTINSNDTRLEYLIRDAHHGLRGNTIKISLNIEYMPIVGPFFKTRLYETTYVMPKDYTNANLK